jgi:hypothetical protein
MGNSEDIFLYNIERRMVDIGVQVEHALKKGISNQAKSGYYRFAILLACTVVEGLLYKIVKKYIDNTNGYMSITTSYKEPHHIPEKYLNEKAVICIQEKKEIGITNQTKFSETVKYAYKNNLINETRKKQLEKIMRLRNRIHIQSLDGKDGGYTKKKLDDIFDAIDFLLKK